MKIVGIIQARMGSSRLPGKIMYPLHGVPLLSRLSQRIRNCCGTVHDWWIATSDNSTDDITASWGNQLGLNVFRGSQDNVLSRFVAIQQMTAADWVIRVTADDPLMHGTVVDLLVAQAIRESAEYVGPDTEHFPLGFVPEIIRADLLSLCDHEASHPSDLEHVTKWIRENRKVTALHAPTLPRRPEWSWTVDTATDHKRMNSVFQCLDRECESADYERLVELHDLNPRLCSNFETT